MSEAVLNNVGTIIAVTGAEKRERWGGRQVETAYLTGSAVLPTGPFFTDFSP